MAIDLGTAHRVVYVSNQGIVLNEPSVVAVKSKTYVALDQLDIFENTLMQ